MHYFILLYITLYCYRLLYITLYYFVLLWITLHYFIILYILLYYFVLLCIALYCLALLYITSYYFILHCILSLIDPMGPKPWDIQHMQHALTTCISEASVDMCHVLIPCSCGACEAYCLSSLYAVSELRAHRACPHYMQFWNLPGTCHAIIHAISELVTHMPRTHYMQFQSLWGTWHVTSTCRSGVYGADAIPSLNAISEFKMHMPCPQRLLHTDLL